MSRDDKTSVTQKTKKFLELALLQKINKQNNNVKQITQGARL